MTSITDQLDTVWTFVSEMPSHDMTSFALLVVGSLAYAEFGLIKYAAGGVFAYSSWVDD